jgi:hypothetical protein
MAMDVTDLLKEGKERFSGFGGEDITTPVLAALSAKQAFTAAEIAAKTGFPEKAVGNVLGRNARKGKKGVGRKYKDNKAYFFLVPIAAKPVKEKAVTPAAAPAPVQKK